MSEEDQRTNGIRRAEDKANEALQGHDQYGGSHALAFAQRDAVIGELRGRIDLNTQSLKSLSWEVRAAWGLLGTVAGIVLAAGAHALGIPI